LLRRLLELVERKGTACGAELAPELGVGPALVESMLEELARRGYLRPLVPARSGGCAGCPARGACAHERAAGVWVLTALAQRRR
jgi:hypothetical protein